MAESVSPPPPVVTGKPEPAAVGPRRSASGGWRFCQRQARADVGRRQGQDHHPWRTDHRGGGVGVPDHRAQSAYLSQLALPILESEVIKSQKAQVDFVSSATDTSYTFQDAVADAIAKATRE